MRYAIKQLNELTTADLGAMMMPSAGARIIRRQSGGFHRDSIAKLAQYCKAIGQTRPNLDALESIAKRIETGKLVLIRIPAPLASGVVSPKGSVNHLLPAVLGNKVHELAQLALVEDIDLHIKNENSVNQSGGHSSAPAVIAAASAASAAPVASRTMADAVAVEPVKETITLNYKYTDGQPIEDIPYIVNHAGDVYEGTLASGSATIPDVVKGSYTVEYKAVDDAEIVALRTELKTNLQGMISEVKVQSKYQEDLIDKEGYVTQGLIYTGAFMTGLYEGGASIVSALVEVVDSGADFVFDVGAACWRVLGHVATGDLAGLRSEFENIAANSSEAFDKIKHCFKTLYIIAMDPESRGMVADFPKDYFDAHSSVEKTRLVGTLAFEIILALATYGVSVAVSAIAKSKYFAKAGQAIQDITKHIKLEKLNHKRGGMTNDDILDEAERIDDELLQSNSQAESALVTESLNISKSTTINHPDSKTVDELIDSDLNASNSLNFKEGDEFKSDAIMDYHINPYTAGLTQDEYLSLHVYTTDLYTPINNGLRGFSPTDKIKWANVSRDADAALVKLSEVPDLLFDGPVIRGDTFSDELLEQLFPVGGIHQDLGFKSSSYNLSKPFKGNTITEIKSKSGVKIDDISVAKYEEEVLFRPNTKFRVLERETLDGVNYIKLEEI